MILNYFLNGVCFALHLCIFVIAFTHRDDKAPYREAFAWLGFVCAMQCLWELGCNLMPEVEIHNQDMATICVDAIGMPFVVLEIECICSQNIKEEPWSIRWKQLGISEIPILIFLIVALFTDWEYLKPAMSVWFVIYSSIFAVRLFRKLREYNNVLSYATDVKNRSINWAAWILGTDILLLSLYAALCRFFYDVWIENLYYILNISIMSVNAYFIWTQRPEDLQEMTKIRKILHDERKLIKDKMEEMEMQMEILTEKASQIDILTNEMGVNAEKLKRKATIKEYMDTARLQHPDFERKLNRAAEGRLTSHDMLICMLIYDGHKVSYIAKMTGVNTRSVEMARSRLRKKLKLNAEDNLFNFIKEQIDSVFQV